MNAIKKIYAWMKYNRAVDMAEKQYAKTGERQYVLSWGCDLIVIDRPSLKFYKKKGIIPQNKTVRDLESTSFYHTPYRNGEGAMTPEVEKHKKWCYYKWFAMVFRWRSVWFKWHKK